MPDFNSKVKSHINHTRTEENFIGISCPPHREQRIISSIKNSQIIALHGKSVLRIERHGKLEDYGNRKEAFTLESG